MTRHDLVMAFLWFGWAPIGFIVFMAYSWWVNRG